MNQLQTRAKILIGSPKNNAACRSFSNMTGGISPGVVIAYQNTNTATNTIACHSRSVFWLGLNVLHLMLRPLLLRPPAIEAAAQLGSAQRASLRLPASAVRSLSGLHRAARPRSP